MKARFQIAGRLLVLLEQARIWLVRRQGLRRFHRAQDPVLAQAVSELWTGMKRTHWMWFMFPQPIGLGWSPKSRIYALTRWEASRYADDPVLMDRLVSMTEIVNAKVRLEGRPLALIFGDVDAQKFRSCMELFADITGHDAFMEALDAIRIEQRWAETARAYNPLRAALLEPEGGGEHGKEAEAARAVRDEGGR